MTDDNKVLELVTPEGSQSPEEALKHLERLVEEGRVKRVLIIFRDAKEDDIRFICGTKEGNYTVADCNWDIDQFKYLHVSGGFESMEE